MDVPVLLVSLLVGEHKNQGRLNFLKLSPEGSPEIFRAISNTLQSPGTCLCILPNERPFRIAQMTDGVEEMELDEENSEMDSYNVRTSLCAVGGLDGRVRIFSLANRRIEELVEYDMANQTNEGQVGYTAMMSSVFAVVFFSAFGMLTPRTCSVGCT